MGMTPEKFSIFNENASRIFSHADWLFKHHGELGLSVESKRSVMLIRNEALKMVELVKDTVENCYSNDMGGE